VTVTTVVTDTAAPRRQKKSEWAQARADALRTQVLGLQSESSPSTAAARSKYAAIRALRDEASRFEGIAQALRRRGQ